MEKDKGHRLVQEEEPQLKIDSSFQSYKDDIVIDDDNTKELMVSWKIKKEIEVFVNEKSRSADC